ncbi:MAG: FkbM family methyltransferase [Bacteroidetes bacterium]|nr:FkbM family methyltransferase [Bacteroidota bacterium]
MIAQSILWYLRHSPVEKKKYLIEKYFKKILPSKDIKEVYTNPDGITFWIDNSDFVMNKIYTRGVYERNTIRHLIELIKGSGGNMIDCGANIGLYSLYLSKYAPKASIHSFEPIKKTLDIFKKNIELNHAENIVINQLGLSNRTGELDLFIVAEDNYGRTSENNTNNTGNKITVQTDTLNHYCSQNNIQEISCIKVDIEGGELNFLKGAQEIIKKSPKIVLIVEINECSYSSGYSPEEPFVFIKNMGFESYKERDYPFSMKKIKKLDGYRGNVIFLKGY